jgi:serine/threonine-protein kinase
VWRCDTDLREQLAAALGDSYALETELGGGGMSRVFLAHETALGRRVAIKVLSPDLAAGVSGDRFRREILLLAKLQHPHIVPVHTVGEAMGLPYFTMPYVEGESLRTRIARDGELPVPEAVRLLRDVASALAYAHAQGIMHRDIKPDNVLLSAGSAVVADFGVAKAISDATAAGHVTLTSTGMALGTPAYMAPEQAVGDASMDFRVDIYAFGVMAYEMLSGRAPFQGRSAQATLAAHVTEMPEPVQRLRPSMPAALAALVMRCLEKHAADRPASAADVLHALDSMATPVSGSTPTLATPLAGRSSDAMPAGAPPTTMRTVLLGLVVAGGAALLLLMLVLLLRQGRAPSNSGQPAVTPLLDSSVREPRRAPAAAVSDSAPPPATEPPASRVQRQASPAPVVRTSPDTAITLQLRAAALDARDGSRAAGATPAQLAAGDTLLKGGDSLRGARRYTEAGMAYSAARAVWAGIVIRQAPSTPTTPAQPQVQAPPPAPVVAQRQDPRPAIQRRVRDYASAIESESTDRIRQVYPGLTAQQERNWRQFFEAVNDVEATLAISSLTVRGDSADATLTGQYAYQNGTTGRAERQPATVSMRLARTADDEWVVVGIR